MLVVLDGPEYQKQIRLLSVLRRLVDRGELKPHRVALVEPENRMETYSASAVYARSLAAALEPLRGRCVGVGASLGGLALLHAHRTHPHLFAGLFLQSGSYFQPRFDRQESGFRRYLRIVRFTGRVLRRPDGPAVPAVLTCGTVEENRANNEDMAQTLRRHGYPVEFAEVPDAHNWVAWRDALDPYLTGLLRRVWTAGN
jgi:enterochelin esterase-like enzyme